MKLKIKR